MHVNTIWYLWISCEEMGSSQFGMLFIGKMGGKYNFVKMPGYLKLTILWCCKFISFFSHFFHVFDVRIKFFRGISQIFKFPVTIFRIERKSPFFCKYQHPWLNHDILEYTLSNSLYMSSSFLISSACAWVGIILSINTDFFLCLFFNVHLNHVNDEYWPGLKMYTVFYQCWIWRRNVFLFHGEKEILFLRHYFLKKTLL